MPGHPRRAWMYQGGAVWRYPPDVGFGQFHRDAGITGGEFWTAALPVSVYSSSRFICGKVSIPVSLGSRAHPPLRHSPTTDGSDQGPPHTASRNQPAGSHRPSHGLTSSCSPLLTGDCAIQYGHPLATRLESAASASLLASDTRSTVPMPHYASSARPVARKAGTHPHSTGGEPHWPNQASGMPSSENYA
jgi:hypothetical protein